jgi:hypothetical protein
MVTRADQSNGGTGLGTGSSYTRTYSSTSDTYNASLAQVINDRLHKANVLVAARLKERNEKQGSSLSRQANEAGNQVTEDDAAPEFCCQKVGDCFRSLFSKKTKTN